VLLSPATAARGCLFDAEGAFFLLRPPFCLEPLPRSTDCVTRRFFVRLFSGSCSVHGSNNDVPLPTVLPAAAFQAFKAPSTFAAPNDEMLSVCSLKSDKISSSLSSRFSFLALSAHSFFFALVRLPFLI